MAEKTETGTEIAKIDRGQIVRWLRGEEEIPVVDDPDDVMDAIIDRVLAADSLDEALAVSSAPAWKDVCPNVVVTVNAVMMRESTKNEYGGIYLLVDITRHDTGERLIVNTGGKKVCATLLLALAQGWLPCEVVLTEKPTAKPGRTVLSLERPVSTGTVV